MESITPGTIECPGATALGIKRAEITATVTRADGTVEELGVIAASDFTAESKEHGNAA